MFSSLRRGFKSSMKANKNVNLTQIEVNLSPDPKPSTSAQYPDTPPAYSVNPQGADPLAKLSEYDTIFIVDDSSSMNADISPGGNTRWAEACRALADFSEIAAKYDKDGIDLYFINSRKTGKGLKSKADVEALFMTLSPCGRTDIGAKLTSLVSKKYMDKLSAASEERASWPKRQNYVIITDGQATDPDILEHFLRDLAQKMYNLRAPQAQMGFQFVQIGNDARASQFLDELDGDNEKLSMDIVDTVKSTPGKAFDGDFLTKVLIGGINRNFDRAV